MKKFTAEKYANLLNNGKSVQYWWADIRNGTWVLCNSCKRAFASISELKEYCGGKLSEFLVPVDD